MLSWPPFLGAKIKFEKHDDQGWLRWSIHFSNGFYLSIHCSSMAYSNGYNWNGLGELTMDTAILSDSGFHCLEPGEYIQPYQTIMDVWETAKKVSRW